MTDPDRQGVFSTGALSDQNLQYAQGMALATLVQVAPKFADWWNKLTLAQQSMIKASLFAAVQAGVGQLIYSCAQAAGSIGAAGAGGYGLAQGASNTGQLAKLFKDHNDELAGLVEKPDAEVTIGKGELEVKLRNLQDGNGDIPMQDMAGKEGDLLKNLEVNKKSVLRRQKQEKEVLNQRIQQTDRLVNVVNHSVLILAKPIEGIGQMHTTNQQALGGLQTAATQNVNSQQQASVGAFDELLRGVSNILGANVALAGRM
jgi:hypothetical protein